MIKTILSLIFALILGYSLTILALQFGVDLLNLRWEIWAAAAFLSAIGLTICLLRKKEMPISPQSELDNLQKEMKLAFKGHLKVSILFWAHYYKKEKVKTFDEAKKIVFQDLKREFPEIPWMQSLLEEIRQELLKYK